MSDTMPTELTAGRVVLRERCRQTQQPGRLMIWVTP